ncbi:desulfoferrodoxin [Candidatus Woesearchaeota archaeon]|nr:desulfoferrodoxin [Candidatus Woesearchaeota archaeon]
MAEKDGLYRCSICGNVISVIEAHDGEIVCCGKPMEILSEKTMDQGQEKHVPVIEKNESGIKVKVGEVPHPMEEMHFISLIQLIRPDGVVMGKRLKQGDKPEAEFCCLADTEDLKARIYCNVHGVWKN